MRYTREDFDQAMQEVHREDDRAKECGELRVLARAWGRLDRLGGSFLGSLVQGHKLEIQHRLNLQTQQPEPFYRND